MYLGSPFDAIAAAIASAAHRDMPEAEVPNGNKYRRGPNEFRVILFPQTWGSTALGYGGIGGQAMSDAYTVIVHDDIFFCVYFGGSGRLAYKIDVNELDQNGYKNFFDDISKMNMYDRRGAVMRYTKTNKDEQILEEL